MSAPRNRHEVRARIRAFFAREDRRPTSHGKTIRALVRAWIALPKDRPARRRARNVAKKIRQNRRAA